MSLSTEQVKWVMDLAGKKKEIRTGAKLQQEKADLLAKAFAALEGKVAEIRLGQDFVMDMKKSGLAGFMRQVFHAAPATMQGIGNGKDPDKQFDTGHDMKDATGLDAEQAAALMKAQSLIVDQVQRLRTARAQDGTKIVITDKEIAKEIWEPLMRRKVIPENAISDQYSDVSRTFQGANEQYDLRLTAYTDSLDDWDGLAAKFGIASDTIKTVGATANNILGLLTAANPAMANFPLTEVTDIVTAITLAGATPLEVAGLVIKDGGLTPKNVEKIAKSLVGFAAATVTAEFDARYSGSSDSDTIGKELGKAIGAGLKIGLSATTFAAKVAQGGDKVKEALDEIGTIVEQCCVCAGSAEAYRDNHKNDQTLALVGRHVKDGLLGAKELLVLMTAAKAKDPVATATLALQNLVKDAIDEGAKTYATARQADRTADEKSTEDKADANDPSATGKADHLADYNASQQFDKEFNTTGDATAITVGTAAVGKDAMDLNALLKTAQTKTVAELQALFKEDPALKANAKAQKLMLAIAKKRDEELAAINATLDQDLADDDATFRALLGGSEGGDDAEELEGIETLLLQLKKDQAMIKMVEAIIHAGPAATAAFFPPAAIAVDAVQVLLSLRKAAAHWMAWRDWNANLTDARSAMSVQAAAMANRAGLSRRKTAEETVNALQAAISLVGNVLGTAGGPVAHAGVAISKGVAVLGVTKDLVLKVYDEIKLKQEWARYKLALNHPDDRKAIRLTIKGNATLAKYVIAYGAVVAEDPVAKNALKKCGLSAKTLQSSKTTEQKVVEYLETLYGDDPVVLERLDSPPAWHPGPVALKASSIAAFSYAAQHKAKPPLAKPIDPVIAKSVMAAEAARPALDLARTAWEAASATKPANPAAEAAALQAFIAELAQLDMLTNRILGNLLAWKPAAPDGKPHKEALAYQAILVRMARSQHKKAMQELAMYE